MRVVFRTDASIQIGTGHVMRCLTLADSLRLQGAECTFVCRSHKGHLIDLIHGKGYKTIALKAHDSSEAQGLEQSSQHMTWLGTDWATDVRDTQCAIHPDEIDWLIVDHYALDHQWEHAMRPFCKHLMVIDDLADRQHDCDVLLDQNLGRTSTDYASLLPSTSQTLIGPRFALLRPEFAQLRDVSLARRQQPVLKHLLITMGGIDKDNMTGQVLEILNQCALPLDLRISVVMGSHAPWLEKIKALANAMEHPTEVLVDVKQMAELMVSSDLVIGAAGGTAWERCCLGIPSLITATASNQQLGAQALASQFAAKQFETRDELASLLKEVLSIEHGPQLLKQMGQSASAISNGVGASLVAQELRRVYA